MRISPLPVEAVSFIVSAEKWKGFATVRHLLEEDGFSIEEAGEENGLILTAPRHFATETGFGQPIEGRRYLWRLKVTILSEGEGARVTLQVADLRIITRYVESMEGEVVDITKGYPYEEYPGMFDLGLVKDELLRVQKLLERNLSSDEFGGVWKPEKESWSWERYAYSLR